MEKLKDDALRFLGRAFRNIDLRPLSDDDLRDIGEALEATRHPPAPLMSDDLVEKIIDAYKPSGMPQLLPPASHAQGIKRARAALLAIQEQS